MRHFDTFLNEIADTLDYDLDDLAIEVEIQTAKSPGHGPSVGPGKVDDECIVGRMRYPDSKGLPGHFYDSLMPFHVEYRVIHLQGEGEVEIPRTIYSFQHHPMPGNCRIAVNRWVRKMDDREWPKDLLKAGLRFRAAVAKHNARCSTLLITTGKSFSGSEPMEEYDSIYDNGTHGVHVLNLKEYFG